MTCQFFLIQQILDTQWTKKAVRCSLDLSAHKGPRCCFFLLFPVCILLTCLLFFRQHIQTFQVWVQDKQNPALPSPVLLSPVTEQLLCISYPSFFGFGQPGGVVGLSAPTGVTANRKTLCRKRSFLVTLPEWPCMNRCLRRHPRSREKRLSCVETNSSSTVVWTWNRSSSWPSAWCRAFAPDPPHSPTTRTRRRSRGTRALSRHSASKWQKL